MSSEPLNLSPLFASLGSDNITSQIYPKRFNFVFLAKIVSCLQYCRVLEKLGARALSKQIRVFADFLIHDYSLLSNGSSEDHNKVLAKAVLNFKRSVFHCFMNTRLICQEIDPI